MRPTLLCVAGQPPRLRAVRVALLAALLLAAEVATGCTSTPATASSPVPTVAVRSASSASAAGRPRSAPALGVPDLALPASVAAAFFTAWASVDSIRDSPEADLARCAHLVTPALQQQLVASQTAPAGWDAMRAEHLVSVIHVRAVTHLAGAPPPQPGQVYLRVYAQLVTTTSAGRTRTSDGITLQLIRHHGRWLVARLLFY